MSNCSNSLYYKDLQIKTTLITHLSYIFIYIYINSFFSDFFLIHIFFNILIYKELKQCVICVISVKVQIKTLTNQGF